MDPSLACPSLPDHGPPSMCSVEAALLSMSELGPSHTNCEIPMDSAEVTAVRAGFQVVSPYVEI